MLKSLLVGLDGSEFSRMGLRLALEWAKPRQAIVGGLAIVDLPGIFQAEAVPLGGEEAKQNIDQARLADARKRGFPANSSNRMVRRKSKLFWKVSALTCWF